MMNPNPLVSIIVRTKDRPKLLVNALKSIAGQIYRPIEVVLVNDGGCDLDTEELKSILCDVLLNYIRLETNTGRAQAGNAGIRNAKGKYIGFLDDDDALFSDHLFLLVQEIIKDAARVVYSDAEIVYRTSESESIGREISERRTFSSRDFSYRDLLADNYIPIMCLLFNKDILEEVQGFDPDFDIYEDWDMLIRIAEKYPFRHVKKATAEYIQWSADQQVAHSHRSAAAAREAHQHIIDKHKSKFSSDVLMYLIEDIRKCRRINENGFEFVKTLERRIEEKEAYISNLDSLVKQKEGEIDRKSREIEGMQKEIDEMQNEIIDLKTHLSKIMHSRGWRIVSNYYKLRDRLLPNNSRRRLFYELFLIAGENPKGVFSKLNRYNLRRFFRQYKSLEPSALENKIKGKISGNVPSGSLVRGDTGESTFDDGIFLRNTGNLTAPKERNRVLVIDRWLPTFDRDSGSLRMFSLLRILSDLGYKVTFLPDDLQKKEPYASELQKIGVEVLGGRVDIEKYLENMGGIFSFVLLSRPEQTFKYVSLIRAYAVNGVVIYDTVDLHWVRFERAAAVHDSRELFERAEYFKSMELFNAACSDVVLTVTDSEKESLLQELPGAKIEVVPNIHDVTNEVKPFSSRKDLMFIGSFFHQPNEDAVFFFVKEIFPMLKEKLSDVKFFVVGSDPSDALLKLNSKEVVVTGYVKDVKPYFENCRVFVSPLRYGAGMKGKIGQSMSYGLPVVTTTIGAEGIGLVNYENALIAEDPKDFADLILKLYTDENLWNTISLNARIHIEKNYSYEAVKEKVSGLFDSLRLQESCR
jgi:glycosyltransferase involved in cell wall biosynthesis